MVIVNPSAGRSSYKNHLGSILHALWSGGYEPTVHFTAKAGDAMELAAYACGRFERIVCIGGDGTLSDVINGLMAHPHGDRPLLGYVPMGTANDVATTLNLSRDPVTATKRILQGDPHPFDVGIMGDNNYFAYIAAFGAFTDVSYETEPDAKHALGHLAYVLNGLMQLSKLNSHRARVECDEGVFEDDFIFGGVTNSTSVAGLVRLDEEEVSLGDGLFEVLLIRNPRRASELTEIITGVLNQDYSGPSVNLLHSRRIHFTFTEPVAWTRDGENGGQHRELLLENRWQAVTLLY